MTSPEPTQSQVTPDPESPDFDALPLTAEVRRAIDELGWSTPTSVQLASYEPAVEGKDLLVQSRTGTGKTAAFGLPLVDRLVRKGEAVQALVLAPTRELALQSARELGTLGKHRPIRTVAIYGGAPMDPQVRALESGVEIVSGTPGRVLDHLTRGTLDPSTLRVLVLDEADEMLSMGFAKELQAIIERLPAKRQTLLFSATVDAGIQRVADRYMSDPLFVGLSSDHVGATTVTHFVYFVSGRGRAHDLVRILEVEDPESAIIFCNTKAETEMVAGQLKQAGFDADWLNGDLPQSEREIIMKRTRQEKLRFLVATDVAARGIDISHLTHVINFSFPAAVEQYIHRTGRTGRAGRTGTALSLVSPLELGSLYYLRLQYKIFPVERSLPTRGEEATRREADRVALLEGAFASKDYGDERAMARRLLTHPDAEQLLAGLLSSFFGAKGPSADVDAEAAAARRAKRPTGNVSAVSDVSVEEPPRRETRSDGDEHPNRPSGGESPAAKPPSAQEEDNPVGEEMARLYVNVGRRDGVRAGDVARFLRDHTELGRSDIGRIRVRDKHSFVDVRSDRVDATVKDLQGKTLNERALVIEPAKSGP